jgi:hypothetical protein
MGLRDARYASSIALKTSATGRWAMFVFSGPSLTVKGS